MKPAFGPPTTSRSHLIFWHWCRCWLSPSTNQLCEHVCCALFKARKSWLRAKALGEWVVEYSVRVCVRAGMRDTEIERRRDREGGWERRTPLMCVCSCMWSKWNQPCVCEREIVVCSRVGTVISWSGLFWPREFRAIQRPPDRTS